ncbi:MAG: hypothetical protein QM233_06390 [Candidatus Cloacimonadota bacterium]|jgi:hypothetical protein|nr:hypothetical protein [Candidatus Cloacimonadota bacterium]OQC09502.1 MAG: hypothetical protein BWX75_01011 [Candidatus Cloacimonetes bacterium ADurb.Bin088]
MKKIAWLMLMLGLAGGLFSFSLTAEGYGSSEESARSDALANLSQLLYVRVDARVTDLLREENSKVFERTVKEVSTSSNLPILGAIFNVEKHKKKEYRVTVALDPQRSLPLYSQKLGELYGRLADACDYLEASGDASLRFQKLLQARRDLEEFDLYRFIYLTLGGKPQADPPITGQLLDKALHELTSVFSDLDLGLKLGGEAFSEYEMIYVFYPSVYPSDETTGFARAVRDRLQGLLSSCERPESAAWYLRSSYEIQTDRIDLHLRLTDKNGSVVRSALISFGPPAYGAYEYEPRTLDLAKLMDMGELVSNDLTVKLRGADGTNQLFFTEGQTVQLQIKANLPCNYYIIAHANTGWGIYSYVLDLGSDPVSRISADLCNRWVQLPEFEVTEPFGVETLQVIASTGSLQGSIPPYRKDNYGLLHISNDPRDAVSLTRGLILSRKEVETTETSLTITTSKW